MVFVPLQRPFLEEFIRLWHQVQSISPTLPEQARHLIHRVDDKVAKIRSQASDKPTTGGDDAESQSTAADQPPQIHCLALQDETASSSDDQPATPLVRKRKRRVAQKITTSAQGIQLPAWQPDIVSEPTSDVNFESMEIKYLKQALASVVQPSTKAEVYLTYLAKCDFNTTLEPHSIIKFNQDDVRSMVGIGQNPNRAEEI